MTFEEAMAAVKDGHAVRRAFWGIKKQDCYLLDAKAMEATDWIIADHECLRPSPPALISARSERDI
jgi:hypothetical protein